MALKPATSTRCAGDYAYQLLQAAPKVKDRSTGEIALHRLTGAPLSVVDIFRSDPLTGETAVLSVTVPTDKVTATGGPVVFEGLTAMQYAIQNAGGSVTAGLAFSADACAPAPSKRGE